MVPDHGALQVIHDTGHDLRLWLSPEGVELKVYYHIPKALVGTTRRISFHPPYKTSAPILRRERIDWTQVISKAVLSQHRRLALGKRISDLPPDDETRPASTVAQYIQTDPGRIEGYLGPLKISLSRDARGSCHWRLCSYCKCGSYVISGSI